MLETIKAVRREATRIIHAAGFASATVHFARQSRAQLPYCAFFLIDSGMSRTSVDNLDDNVLEFHFVAGNPDDAVKMLDAWVEYCRELGGGEMAIAGHRLVGCEMQGGRSVQDVTETEDTYDASVAFKFTTSKIRPAV